MHGSARSTPDIDRLTADLMNRAKPPLMGIDSLLTIAGQ